MSTEIGVLGLYGLFMVVVLLIHVVTAMGQLGLVYLASPRDEARKLTGIPGRVERALNNCVVSMSLFAPAALIVHVSGASTATTVLAAQIFLIARVVYVPVYAFGIPWLRTLIFVAGLLATLVLYLAIL